jgi:hypothetical protein
VVKECDSRDKLLELYHAAKEAPSDKAVETWAAYYAHRRMEEARRDCARKVYEIGANALAERIGQLRGVAVEGVMVDDFGRASIHVVVNGKHYWTRPNELTDERAYSRLRDAIAAARRGDWPVATRQLTMRELKACHVTWNLFEQIRLDRDMFGYSEWQD